MNVEEKNVNIALDADKEGSVVISDDVISVISSVAAKGVKGVFGMNTSLSGGFAEFLGKKNPSKGVKVQLDGNNCVIDVYVTVEYGAVIPDVAWEIQERVKNDVEAMTGLDVTAVNVNVEGINVIKEKEEAAEEKTEASEENADTAEDETL